MATYGYLCPTPKQHCSGTLAKLNAGLDKKGILKHGSRQEARNCYSNYLVEVKGCEKLSNSEFKHPNGGGIEVLTKLSRFGTELRSGKGGEAGMQSNKRGMPRGHAAITGS